MLGTIRRHQAWLWWFIAGVTIISFVILGPSGCEGLRPGGGGRGGAGLGSIGDHAITREEFQKAANEVTLRDFLSTGHWPEEKGDLNVSRESLARLFLIEKEKQFGVQPDAGGMLDLSQRIIGKAPLDNFVSQILK